MNSVKLSHHIKVIENMWICMHDGCRLAARIWMPDDADKNPVPAIPEYLPSLRTSPADGSVSLNGRHPI